MTGEGMTDEVVSSSIERIRTAVEQFTWRVLGVHLGRLLGRARLRERADLTTPQDPERHHEL